MDPSGRILTNYHVVRDAKSARIRLASGDVYEMVEVLEQDPRRDIAVLQIPGFDLPSLELGNSDSLRVGSPVVLIGSCVSKTPYPRASSAAAAASPRGSSSSR